MKLEGVSRLEFHVVVVDKVLGIEAHNHSLPGGQGEGGVEVDVECVGLYEVRGQDQLKGGSLCRDIQKYNVTV